MLRAAESGGAFEYVPNIRSSDDENYDAVREVLDGTYGGVQALDLQLFRGGNTLHRVTAPSGPTGRLSLLLSHVENPDHIATPEYVERLWGEVHPLHRERTSDV